MLSSKTADNVSSIQSAKWRSENREKYNKMLNEYYHKNKEKLTAKIECEVCGIIYSKNHKATHFKSKFHNHIKNLKESYGETF